MEKVRWVRYSRGKDHGRIMTGRGNFHENGVMKQNNVIS